MNSNSITFDIIAHQWKELFEKLPKDRHDLDRKMAEKLARFVHSSDQEGYVRKEYTAPRDVFKDLTNNRVIIFSKGKGRKLPAGGVRRPTDAIEIKYDQNLFPDSAKPLIRLSKAKETCDQCPIKHSVPFTAREIKLEKRFGLLHDVLTYDTKEGEEKTILLQEPFDGDLTLFMDALLPAEKMKVFCDVVAHLSEMHTQGFCHADLKAKNVIFRRLIDGQVEARLCDFETAFNLADPEYPKEKSLNTVYGTQFYTAPERLTQKGLLQDGFSQGKAEDMFALGYLLIELIFGYTVKDAKNSAWDTVKSGLPQPKTPLEDAFLSLARQLVAETPGERLTIEQVEEELTYLARRAITD